MKIGDEIVGPIKAAWHRFLERTEPARADLFRYCRSLSGSVWDGEDLVQDTLLRAFARLSEVSEPIGNVRGYLFRIASNLWIDKHRGTHEFASAEVTESTNREVPFRHDVRDAAKELLTHLPPMERAVVLLKDVFDLSLEETATALDTTLGAVKAALHRGRTKLRMPEASSLAEERLRGPSVALVEQFVDAFNGRDVHRLVGLIREDASSEMLGMVLEHGREAIGNSKKGVLHHTFASHPSSDTFRAELCDYEGEPIVLFWIKDADCKGVVSSILKLDERDGAVAHLRYYYFCPEVLAEVCGEIGVPVKTNGYRPS